MTPDAGICNGPLLAVKESPYITPAGPEAKPSFLSLPAGIGQGGSWAAADGTFEGLGVDPVFQLYSYLWNPDVYGQEQQYYNMSKVPKAVQPPLGFWVLYARLLQSCWCLQLPATMTSGP